jgi:alkylation response protein AidB-like acyl-CoA dehydrogenase
MAAIRPRDLLSDELLERLGGTRDAAGLTAAAHAAAAPAVPPGADVAATLTRDIAKLVDVGYLNVALPAEFGGLGCTLRQAACGQRRLARHAPLTALAVSAHLYWTGAAADAYRAGDSSAKWILLEAARGAVFGAGHGLPGHDLRFADPQSRCEAAGESGYRFRHPAVVSSLTPAWDWVAVHAVTPAARHNTPDAVLAFAGRGSRCTPAAFRVARVHAVGSPGDVFTTSAIGWGHSILASVEYSDARRAFNQAVESVERMGVATAGGHPLDQWPVAEASLRLDAMKARIAEVTHPWPLVRGQEPDLGGQRLIGIFTMRHEVADGARHVFALTSQIADAQAVAAR